MKTLLLILLSCLTINCYCQDVKINKSDKTITTTKSINNSKSDIDTGYKWIGRDGKHYTIYKTKNNAYYVIRISSKTGKEYKYYLPKDIKEELINAGV